MKYKVTHFKSPQVALKELEPFIRDGRHLYTGKPFGRFGELRSRELVGNWLICAVLNAGRPTAPFTFTSDPQDGDGIIYDRDTETGPIALPLLPAQAEQLISVAQRAPFGRGEQTVVDTDVRRTWQIDAARVRIHGAVAAAE